MPCCCLIASDEHATRPSLRPPGPAPSVFTAAFIQRRSRRLRGVVMLLLSTGRQQLAKHGQSGDASAGRLRPELGRQVPGDLW